MDVYVTLDDWRTVDVTPSPRDVRDAAVPVIVAVPVAERVTTRRVDWLGDAARAVFVAPAVVPLRAVVVFRDDTFRVVTPRAVPVAALRAFVVPMLAARAVLVLVAVALRAVAVVVVARRGTTLRVVVLSDVFVRASTFIWAPDCDGVVPGFKPVRIVLFIYGYRLLYVFALT